MNRSNAAFRWSRSVAGNEAKQSKPPHAASAPVPKKLPLAGTVILAFGIALFSSVGQQCAPPQARCGTHDNDGRDLGPSPPLAATGAKRPLLDGRQHEP